MAKRGMSLGPHGFISGDLANPTSKAPSKHSRAARRATSPSINTDKSLKNARPPPVSVSHRPSILGLHAAAGVSKKKSGRKAIQSAKAKRRMDKSQDRAEQVMERTEKKVARSRGKAKTIKERSRGWDDINTTVDVIKKNPKVDDKGEEWEDEEMEVEEEGQEASTSAAALPPAETEEGDLDGDATMEAPAAPVVPVMVPLPPSADDEDEIL